MSQQDSIPKPGVAIMSLFGTSERTLRDTPESPDSSPPRKPKSPASTTAGKNSARWPEPLQAIPVRRHDLRVTRISGLVAAVYDRRTL